MEIYLIRHTTPQIEKGICYGQSDIPLADSFDEELEEILNKGPFLKDEIAVYSSPLQRCKILAESLCNSSISYNQDLVELNFGDWELQSWDAINKTELNAWMKDFVNVSCPNGESFTDLHKRVVAFYQSLILSEHDKVTIVTHAGVIRALLAFHNDTLLVDSFKMKIEYGEVIKIETPPLN